MKKNCDLEEFIKILTDKGYNGYFMTQAGYPGKLADSLGGFLESLDPEFGFDKNVLLETYLDWNGEDKPSIQCLISLENDNGKFAIDVMEIIHKDRFGKSISEKKLMDIAIDALPTRDQAIKMVREEVRKISSTLKRGRRF
ncbi:hypothetical protein BAZ12_08605 [Elizabethkingia miricola]|uniref:hypothetical protein n=1 Tax=Bacteroidota TaxID=976 RepID=UPI00099976E9|nr:hypothetical protein [Elizabethkingia miricola]OPC69875.1 hypothetical protein BAZ12_08605 [Elizabethkingia miricola]